jgi:hypothetical protein
LWVVFLLLMAAVIIWLLIRRRRMQDQYGLYASSSAGPSVFVSSEPGAIDMPAEQSAQVPPPPQFTVPPTSPTHKSDPSLEHVGESLKDMVLKSMHEEAQKRTTRSKAPKVPGDDKPA